MKRALAWMAGLVGIAALGRLLSRRSARVAEPATDDDPAAALRQRLETQRAAVTDEPEEATCTTGETLEERRTRIHEKARQAIDAMREPGA